MRSRKELEALITELNDTLQKTARERDMLYLEVKKAIEDKRTRFGTSEQRMGIYYAMNQIGWEPGAPPCQHGVVASTCAQCADLEEL